MRFGSFSYNQARPWAAEKQAFDELLEQILLTDQLGFDEAWFAEHHHSDYGMLASPTLLIANLAPRTKRLRMGNLVSVLPLYDPMRFAEECGMLDILTNGRLNVGLGRGVPKDDMKHRLDRDTAQARFEEGIEILIRSWTGETFSYSGKAWGYEEISCRPLPLQKPHPPIWVAGTSAQGLGWAGRQGYHIMTVGHPHPPDKVRLGVDAWKAGLREAGLDPSARHCQFHVRTHVNENAQRAREIGMAAVTRYDEISRIGRRSLTAPPAEYDWNMMLATGRNNYGTPEQVIQGIHNAAKNYYFDTLTTTFNFGGIAHEEIKKSMRLFAEEVMPAFG